MDQYQKVCVRILNPVLEFWKIPFPSLSQHLKKLNFGTNSNELGSLIWKETF